MQTGNTMTNALELVSNTWSFLKLLEMQAFSLAVPLTTARLWTSSFIKASKRNYGRYCTKRVTGLGTLYMFLSLTTVPSMADRAQRTRTSDWGRHLGHGRCRGLLSRRLGSLVLAESINPRPAMLAYTQMVLRWHSATKPKLFRFSAS